MSNGTTIPDLKDNDCKSHNLIMRGAYSRLNILEGTVMHPDKGLVVTVTKLTEWVEAQKKESGSIKKMLLGIWATVVASLIIGGMFYFSKGG